MAISTTRVCPPTNTTTSAIACPSGFRPTTNNANYHRPGDVMNYKTSLRFVTLIIVLATTPVANATLLPNPNGKTVYDTLLGVNWAANANLPGTVNNNFDGRLGFPQCDGVITVPCVDQNGAMSYETALLWLSALNGLHGGNGYLDHTDWTLPTTAQTDPTCSAIGPNNNSFGFGCRNSALGSLYYTSLGFAFLTRRFRFRQTPTRHSTIFSHTFTGRRRAPATMGF